MAKKNLAATLIDTSRGGKWDRRYRNRVARRLGVVRLTDDFDEVLPIHYQMLYRGKGLRDKLGPVRRWLMKQLGRPWNDIWSELTKRYDRRNFGRYQHLLTHIKDYIEFEPGKLGRYTEGIPYGFYVGAEGTLKYMHPKFRRWLREPIMEIWDKVSPIDSEIYKEERKIFPSRAKIRALRAKQRPFIDEAKALERQYKRWALDLVW